MWALHCINMFFTMITSRCKITLWDNQYVWIWLQAHAHTTRSKSVSCLLLLLLLLSCYKASVFGVAPWGLPTSTRGDVTTVSPGQTAEYHHLHRHRRSLQAAQHSRTTSMAPFEKSMEVMPFKQRKCLGEWTATSLVSRMASAHFITGCDVNWRFHFSSQKQGKTKCAASGQSFPTNFL